MAGRGAGDDHGIHIGVGEDGPIVGAPTRRAVEICCRARQALFFPDHRHQAGVAARGNGPQAAKCPIPVRETDHRDIEPFLDLHGAPLWWGVLTAVGDDRLTVCAAHPWIHGKPGWASTRPEARCAIGRPSNPVEAQTIKAEATNVSKKAINSALMQHTLHFENTLKRMVETGSVFSEELQQEIPITEEYLNALIKEYEEITAPLIDQLGDPNMKNRQQALIRKSVVAVTDKMQRAAGPHSIEDDDLTQRYASQDPQTQYLFIAERDKLYAKLNNAGITSDLAEAVRVAATPEQLQEVISNIKNERERELVSDFYNVVPLVKKETKAEEEIPDQSQFPEYDEIEDMDHYDNYSVEVNPEMIEDLLDKDILKPCDL